MIFQNDFLIYLALLIVAALIIIFNIGLRLKKRLLNNFGDLKIIKKFSPDIDFKRYEKKTILILIIIFLSFLSLSRPQWGNKLTNISRKGLNILIMLDISKSMFAEDMKPNRL